MVSVVHVSSPEHITNSRALFLEYAHSLPFSLEFQGFDQEVATLPGEYAPPNGRLLLAICNSQAAGCIALRKLDEGICEMKRLYVAPAFRGQKFDGKTIGISLIIGLLQEAQKLGYKKMRLDTVPSMERAITLYKALGFKEIEPYYFNPQPGAIFLELNLTNE